MIKSFCHYIHFFANPAAAAEWTTQHEGTFTLSLAEGSEIARVTNRGRSDRSNSRCWTPLTVVGFGHGAAPDGSGCCGDSPPARRSCMTSCTAASETDSCTARETPPAAGTS